MTDLLGDDNEWTEAVDADIPRVDLVGMAANGVPGFLLMKQEAGGLLDPAYVRELLAKSESENDSRETVTMTGSPGAIAKMIHAAGRPSTGTAPDAPDAAVAKAVEPDTTVAELDPTVVLAEPDGGAPGDPSDPGSPAWEAIDAATARKWTSILSRAKTALGVMSEREMLEAVSADRGDAESAMDLDDAACAIDYAISVLAPFAVDEQAEADCADDMQMVGKALAGFDAGPLDTIEALSMVAKAGRVLSTANEAAIRGAVESLQKVLASLPAAPTAPEEGDRPVAKEEETVAETATDMTVPEAVTKDDPEKVPQVAVYDKNGKLVGIVDPANLVTIADTGADDDGPDDTTEDTTEDAAVELDAAPEAAPETADLVPAPAAEVGIPADAVPDDVNKQTDTPTTDTPPDAVLKSIAKDAATAALADYSATQEQVIAKQADDLAQLADVVKSLKGQVEALEEQPAVPKVFTNGAVPPRDQLRGQDRGASPVDVAKAQLTKKSLYEAADAAAQNRIANDMQADAIARLQEIHHGGAPQ